MKFLNSLAVVLTLASTSAFAAGGNGEGDAIGPSVQAAPIAASASGSLAYSGIVGTCSSAGFSTTSATGTTTFPSQVSVARTAKLDGVDFPAAAGSFTLTSPMSFSTSFNRTFPAPLASNTFSFVYSFVVTWGGEVQGINTVTVSCNAGVFSATSVWADAPPRVVPVGSPALYGLIGMLLIGIAGIALRRR